MYLNYLVDWVEKVPEIKENTHLRTGPVFPPGLASCGLKRTPGRRSGPGVRPGGDELVERGAEGGCFPPGNVLATDGSIGHLGLLQTRCRSDHRTPDVFNNHPFPYLGRLIGPEGKWKGMMMDAPTDRYTDSRQLPPRSRPQSVLLCAHPL